MTLSATLALRPDAERIKLRLGTAFIEHRDDLWPESEPAATPEWIRDHVDDILAAMEKMLCRDGRDVRRLPHRLHWVQWLHDEIDGSTSSQA